MANSCEGIDSASDGNFYDCVESLNSDTSDDYDNYQDAIDWEIPFVGLQEKQAHTPTETKSLIPTYPISDLNTTKSSRQGQSKTDSQPCSKIQIESVHPLFPYHVDQQSDNAIHQHPISDKPNSLAYNRNFDALPTFGTDTQKVKRKQLTDRPTSDTKCFNEGKSSVVDFLSGKVINKEDEDTDETVNEERCKCCANSYTKKSDREYKKPKKSTPKRGHVKPKKPNKAELIYMRKKDVESLNQKTRASGLKSDKPKSDRKDIKSSAKRSSYFGK